MDIKFFNMRTLPPWRKRLIQFINNSAFKAVVYLSIIYAAAQLAWPYVTWPNWNGDLAVNSSDPSLSINVISDILVLLVFLFEAVFKMIGYGVGLTESGTDIEAESEDSTYPDKLKPEEEEAIHKIFTLFDVDKSGTMSEVELRLAFRGLGFAESSENIHRIFQEMDRDGSQEIDFNEFKEVMATHILRQPPPPAYFSLGSNQLDFAVLVVSCVVLPIQFFLPDAKKVGDIARIVRLSRLWSLFDSDRLRGMKDVFRTFSAALGRTAHVLALIVSALLLYATIGVDLFGDGQLHARCVVAPNNTFAAAASATAARIGLHNRSSTVGELSRPERHCGFSACGEGFECRCSGADEDGGAPPGCARIPSGRMGETGGLVPLDYGFLGFDNVLQGSLTSYIGMTQARTRSTPSIPILSKDAMPLSTHNVGGDETSIPRRAPSHAHWSRLHVQLLAGTSAPELGRDSSAPHLARRARRRRGRGGWTPPAAPTSRPSRGSSASASSQSAACGWSATAHPPPCLACRTCPAA